MQALSGRGITYLLYTHDFGKAIADFTEVIQLASNNDDDVNAVHYLQGLAYANRPNELDKACSDMAKALRGPRDEEFVAGACLIRTVAQIRNGNLGEALAEATKAIEANPRSADAYALRCYIYEKKGDQDKAKADRTASKRLRGETASNSNDLDVAAAAVLHRCLTQLVPALE